MPQPMHSPTCSGCSIIHAQRAPGPGPVSTPGALRAAHVEGLDRAHVHADAARDAAAMVDVDAVAHRAASFWRDEHPRRDAVRPRPDGQGGCPPDGVGAGAVRPGPFGPIGPPAGRSAVAERGPPGRLARRPRPGSGRGACRGCCAGGTSRCSRRSRASPRSPCCAGPPTTRRSTSSSRSVRRSGPRSTRPDRAPAGELRQDAGRDRRGDRGLASFDRLEHRAELRRVEVLEQVAPGPGLDGREQVVDRLARREHHDRDRRAALRRSGASPRCRRPGIATSISTRSGRELARQGDGRRRRPPPDPTTSWPHAPRSEATPSRNRAWSSASRIRTVSPPDGPRRRPARRRAIDRPRRVARARPVAGRASRGCRRRRRRGSRASAPIAAARSRIDRNP